MTARQIGPRSPRKLQREFGVLVMTATDDCLIWPHYKVKGYGYIGWNKREVGVHQLACLLFHGEQPSPAHEVAHACGNRACFNPAHLRWATRAENMADAIGHGRTCRGTKHHGVVLTEATVKRARQMRASGMSYQAIADSLNASIGTIYDCVNYRTWGWLQ